LHREQACGGAGRGVDLRLRCSAWLATVFGQITSHSAISLFGARVDWLGSRRGNITSVSVQHQPLLLVQARNLITNLALPALLTDPEGQLLFFNDAAAGLLGRSFEEVGRLSREQWARQVAPVDEQGRPLAADSLPLARALREGRPAHGRLRARLGESGVREVELSALPLLEPGSFEGALVVFWPVEVATPVTT
jgi:PAS domain-containing protein